MAFYKKNNQGFDFKNRTIHSNVADMPKTHERKFYAVIEIEGVDCIFEYTCINRSEALAQFQEDARMHFGKLKLISTFK